MKTVIFLSGRTMGDALAGVGRLWSEMFERFGVLFVEVNLAQPDAPRLLNETVRNHQVEAVISFVGMAANLPGTTSDGKEVNFWQTQGIPFISLYGDSPAYFFDRHVLPGRSFAALYGFPEHYALRKRLPRITGLLGTIPVFVVDPLPRADVDFHAKEAGKILFLKNGNDPNRLLRTWSASLSETMYDMLANLACQLAADLNSASCNDIDKLVTDFFLAKGYDIDALLNVRMFFIAQLDDYCRRLKSTLIAEALLDLPVEVHGYNWEHVNFGAKRAKLIPLADFTTSRMLIKNSLAVIDMSPNTSLVPHERVRRAFGAYTLCLTNEQQYFRDTFTNSDAFTFSFDKESIQHSVAGVIRHPKRYVELGMTVADKFRTNEDVNAAARFLLEVASVVRLENAARLPGLQEYFGWPVGNAD
jgi:hypothetical protein